MIGTRFISFTFDDGLIVGARKTAALFEQFGARATFYIVTGWVLPRRIPWIRDGFNRGRDHGTWDDWRSLADRGHEIGAHTFSHLNALGRVARRFPALIPWELRRASRDINTHLGNAPATCSMPWNAVTPHVTGSVHRIYSAMRLGSPHMEGYNHVPPEDWYSLRSWAPDSTIPVSRLTDAADGLQAGEWLILQFHSLDGEGYMPMESARLRQLLQAVAERPALQVVTVAEMVRRAGALRSASVG
jgi:peptidoglycan/xylan/chitin deacetylase (PgdA/CDA1 family)